GSPRHKKIRRDVVVERMRHSVLVRHPHAQAVVGGGIHVEQPARQTAHARLHSSALTTARPSPYCFSSWRRRRMMRTSAASSISSDGAPASCGTSAAPDDVAAN